MKALLKDSEKFSPILKNYSTDKPCLACGISTENGNTLHHIKTRGSGGSDDPWNLMPLCHTHHVEVHQSGLMSFTEKYKRVGLWLVWNNWSVDSFNNKWSHFVNT